MLFYKVKEKQTINKKAKWKSLISKRTKERQLLKKKRGWLIMWPVLLGAGALVVGVLALLSDKEH